RLPYRTWRQRLLESTGLGRRLIFLGTRRRLRRRVADDMPAPWEALEAERVGLSQGTAGGPAYEREAVRRLATATPCRTLVSLFFRREQARAIPQSAPAVQRVGVVGAGTTGAGIAQLAALRGCDVVVQEVNEEALAAGMHRIEALLKRAVERRLLTKEL